MFAVIIIHHFFGAVNVVGKQKCEMIVNFSSAKKRSTKTPQNGRLFERKGGERCHGSPLKLFDDGGSIRQSPLPPEVFGENVHRLKGGFHTERSVKKIPEKRISPLPLIKLSDNLKRYIPPILPVERLLSLR